MDRDASPKRRRLLPYALGAVILATAALVAAVVVFGGDDDDGGDGGVPAGPVTIGGVEFRPFFVGEAARLPETTALFVTTGCFECAPPDHYIKTIARVYRDSQGTIRTETLFTARPSQAVAAPAAPLPASAYILEVATKPDASEIVATVCLSGGCASFDKAVERPAVALYRSTDGGVTWAEYGRFEAEPARAGDPLLPRAIALAREGSVLLQPGRGAAAASFTLYPSGAAVEAPAGLLYPRPGVTPEGDLAWVVAAPGGLRLEAAGKSYPLPALARDAKLSGPPFFIDPSRVVITSQVESKRPVDQWPRFYAVVGLESGLQVGWTGLHVRPAAVVSGATTGADVTLPADRRSVLGISRIPGLVDFDSGAVNPIAVPFAGPGERTPAQVLAALEGPFARAVRRETCVGLRARPDAAAPATTCLSAATLLRVTGAEASGFVPLALPDGTAGWALAGEIER
ncbi:MAG: hypothetical protein ACR2HN_14140 [Tepidiformaceae bacterium]